MARRVCAQCGKRESRWPWQMFAIWKSTTHAVDLCSFDCSRKWYTITQATPGEAAATAPVDAGGEGPGCECPGPSDDAGEW